MGHEGSVEGDPGPSVSETERGPSEFPPIKRAGAVRQRITDSPESVAASVALLTTLASLSSNRSIRIKQLKAVGEERVKAFYTREQESNPDYFASTWQTGTRKEEEEDFWIIDFWEYEETDTASRGEEE